MAKAKFKGFYLFSFASIIFNPVLLCPLGQGPKEFIYLFIYID